MEPLEAVEANRRVANLRRWLSKPPARAVRARLVTAADGQMVLGEWDRESFSIPMLADDIEALAREHLEESDAARVHFVLAFEDESGRPIMTKPFSMRRTPAVDEDGTRSIAGAIDGGTTGVTIQMQAQLERMHRMNMQTQHQLNEFSLRMIDKMLDRFLTAEERQENAREELFDFKQALVRVADAAERGEEPPPMSDGQRKFWELMEQFGPVIIARLASGGGGPPPAST